MAGLTTGLLSLDMLNMRILEREGTPAEKRYALRVIPVLSHHHFLLVTLMLINAAANEALPIFLSKIVPESISILVSVTCVLLFGEILPSAFFTGPKQLQIAAFLTPFVRLLMFLVSPIAYPLAKCLDWILGADHEELGYKRQELKALVAIQRENRLRHAPHDVEKSAHDPTQDTHTPSGKHLRHTSDITNSFNDRTIREKSSQSKGLHLDEVSIIHGALDLSAKSIREVMIPMDKVYMLEYQTKLNHDTMADILASGYSRIPIYRDYPCNIVGLLLVKRLIVVDSEGERCVGDLALRKPIVASPNASCYHILNEFQKGHSHIALVTSDQKTVFDCWQQGIDIPQSVSFVGILTIEDVIEEIIGEEIEDESDVYTRSFDTSWRSKIDRTQSEGVIVKTPLVRKRLITLAHQARYRVKHQQNMSKQRLEQSIPASVQEEGEDDKNTPIEISIK